MTGFFSGASDEGNARRRQIIADMGKDALRKMNPFRDSTAAEPTPQSPLARMPTSFSASENTQPVTANLRSKATDPLASAGLSSQDVATMPSHTPAPAAAEAHLRENPHLAGEFRKKYGYVPDGTPAALNSPPPQPFKATLSGGMTYEGDNQGNRTYSMGTPGQDGYGRVSVRPGNDVGQSARSALSTMPGQRTAQVGDGLTATGSQDAINRLSAPVGKVDYSSPIYQRYEAENRAKEAYVNREPVQSDFPLIAPPPIAIGTGGWKSRIAANEANSRAYGDYVRAVSGLASQGMQERGADRRADILDRRSREQNDISRRQAESGIALNQASIDAKGVEQQKGQMEVDQAKKMNDLNDQYLAEKDPVKQKALGNKLLTMNGKNTKDWQITTREEPLDPANPMLGTTKRPYAVNLNDPNQVIELGAGGGGGDLDPAMAFINSNPQAAKNFAAMPPERQKEVYNQIMNKLMKRGRSMNNNHPRS